MAIELVKLYKDNGTFIKDADVTGSSFSTTVDQGVGSLDIKGKSQDDAGNLSVFGSTINYFAGCNIGKSIKTQIQLEKNRKDRLLDLLLDRDINEEVAKNKMKEIDAKLLSYEAELEMNQLKDIEVKILLNSFKHFILNFGDWWLNTTDLKIKERIQSIIFPNKVSWDGEKFRTGKTPLFMRISSDLNTPMLDWYP